MSTTEDNDENSSDDLERKVGGAEILPPDAKVALPQTPPTPQPHPSIELATSSIGTLDRRLNPDAPVFVPEFKAQQLATKLYDGLAPYTRWSTASSEDLSYGPRFDSIWREFNVDQLRPTDPTDTISSEDMVDLELDELQAINIGAESYDPKLSRSATNPIPHSEVQIVEIVGELQQSQDQTPVEEGDDSGKDFQIRHPRAGRRCCIIM